MAKRCLLLRATYRESLAGDALDGCHALLVHYERSLVPGPEYLPRLAAKFPGRVFLAPHEVYRDDPFAFPYSGLRSAFPPFLWLKRLRYRWRHRDYAAEQALQRSGYHAHRVIPLSREGGEILASLASGPEIAARILRPVPVARVEPPPPPADPAPSPGEPGRQPGGRGGIPGQAGLFPAEPGSFPGQAGLFPGQAGLFPAHDGAVAGIFGFLNPGLDYGAAFDLAEAMGPSLAVALLGGERAGYPMSAGLGAEIRRRGLEGRVRITGYLPEAALASRLAACDFFLSPMRCKSSSASVLQLFGQGKPILVPDLPLTRYLEEEGAPIIRYAGADDLLAKARAAAAGTLAAPPDRYPWDIDAVAAAYLAAMLA